MSSATSTRRLVRPTDDRIVAGVASGLSDRLGIDAVLVRVAFVVLAFVAGAGILAYVALWLVTPEAIGGAPRRASPDRGAAFWVALSLFVLAGLVIADSLAERSITWPLVLIGVGVALWRSDRPGQVRRARTIGPTAMPDRFAAPPATPTPPASSTVVPGPPPVPPLPPAPPSPPPVWTPPPPPGRGSVATAGSPRSRPPRRPRSVLGRFTVAITLLTVGTLVALDRLDVLEVTARDALAATLLVLGLGLIVGAWFGRARWLALPIVLIVLPSLLVANAAQQLQVSLGAGVGSRSFGTNAAASVDPVYELGVGDLRLDFGDLRLSGTTVRTTARVGVGSVFVVVPDDATVVVAYDVTGGQVDLFERQLVGVRNLHGTEVLDGPAGAGRLEVDARVGLGRIEIRRFSDVAAFNDRGHAGAYRVPDGSSGVGPEVYP